MTTDEQDKSEDTIECAVLDNEFQYEKLKILGRGGFGEVFKARDKKTKKMVALKRMIDYDKKTGLSISARNEIGILELLNHNNVVTFHGSCIEKTNELYSCYIVLELCDLDLTGLLESDLEISLGHKKNILKQILLGLQYIHERNVVQLDMKPSNILLTKAGVVKLADFGMAETCRVSENEPNTCVKKMVTLWYRPPELLLGETYYGPAVDMWGAGCIMAELWTRDPIMQGWTEQEQLDLITDLCGSFNPEEWSCAKNLNLNSDYKLIIKKGQERKVRELLQETDLSAYDLLELLLNVDPSKRLNTKSALQHNFFMTEPIPTDLRDLLQDLDEAFTPPAPQGTPPSVSISSRSDSPFYSCHQSKSPSYSPTIGTATFSHNISAPYIPNTIYPSPPTDNITFSSPSPHKKLKKSMEWGNYCAL